MAHATLQVSQQLRGSSIVSMVLDNLLARFGDIESFLLEYGVKRAAIRRFRDRTVTAA